MRQQNGQGGHRRHHGNRGGNRGGDRNGGGSGNQGNGMRRPQSQVPLRNQMFDSHGPEGVRVRGNAFQVYEKYMTLAREAGERIDAENYYQHAEHFYRIVEAIQEYESEQRSRYEQQPQPGVPGAEGEQPAMGADPFAPPAEGNSGMVDLTSPTTAAAQ